MHEIVKKNLEDFHVFSPQDNVFLIKGLLQDTMTINQPVAFAHIDVDWYDPVLTCLKRIFPYLVSGGCIIIDDYHDWGGCRKACDEYLRTIVGEVKLDDKAGALKIIKK